MALDLHHSTPMATHAMPVTSATPRPMSLDEVTRAHVLSVLEQCNWSQTRAAQLLAIDRKTIYRMLRRWGVDVQSMRTQKH